MKKIIILFLLTIQCAQAQFNALLPNDEVDLPNEYSYFFDDCDACGCSASGGSMGFNSMLSEQFLGVRYMYQHYKSKDGVFNNSPWIDENFSTAQIWGRIPVNKKIEVMVMVPYHFLNREKASGNQTLDGMGDVTVMAFYNVLQTMNDSASFQHKILIGAGVKAPTGKFDNKNNGSVNPSFQLGTGSWDYNVAAEYIIRKDKWGLNSTLGYIVKTENDKKYQFGNQLNYGSTIFYTAAVKNVNIVPQLGVAGETYQPNKDYSEEVPYTKGDIFFGKIGVEIGYKKFSAGVNAMLPINQNLTGGRVEADYRVAFNINYIL
ncbi:transporter family protein [Paenimyroides baculatum]|uniref:Transporter n=1 Tax=Paenimyroides baculatum TaxID=2608000 RepID=A0A5M6CU13_9FLAO|nr:transporter [Paenimyroides baculatum]KAA5538456.1 transporter [Paenimyroides baculatum]